MKTETLFNVTNHYLGSPIQVFFKLIDNLRKVNSSLNCLHVLYFTKVSDMPYKYDAGWHGRMACTSLFSGPRQFVCTRIDSGYTQIP